MPVDPDAEHVVRLALVPVRRLVHRGDARHARVVGAEIHREPDLGLAGLECREMVDHPESRPARPVVEAGDELEPAETRRGLVPQVADGRDELLGTDAPRQRVGGALVAGRAPELLPESGFHSRQSLLARGDRGGRRPGREVSRRDVAPGPQDGAARARGLETRSARVHGGGDALDARLLRGADMPSRFAQDVAHRMLGALDLLLEQDQRLEQRLRAGRTALHVDVHRQHGVHALKHRVDVEHPARVRARAHRDHPAGLRHLLVEPQDRRHHLLERRARHHHDVRLARGPAHHLGSEARDVVARGDRGGGLDEAAREAEEHRPQGVRTAPVDQVVELRDQDRFPEGLGDPVQLVGVLGAREVDGH